MVNMLERVELRSSQNNLKPDDSDTVVVVALATGTGCHSELVVSSGRTTGKAGTGRGIDSIYLRVLTKPSAAPAQ